MTPTRFVLAFTCLLTAPALALAQTPAAAPASRMDCCAAAGNAGHASLLPLTLPEDERATALAASVLLPVPAPAAVAAADMACCGHHGTSVMTGQHHGHQPTHDGPHAGMKGGCDMPCCQTPPPER